ncbi:MAG: carbohydrate ABC transporter permease [Oscillospiraceae bacterium]|nr:carbohydrate ABC transporter permease [Oscillospiraceae bacterium]
MARSVSTREPIKIRKDLRLAPGYLLCGVWALFTFLLIGWTIAASLVTPREIFGGDVLGAFFERLVNFDLVFNNYVLAWGAQNLSRFFVNSVIYSVISLTLIIIIAAPASYALSRFKFRFNAVVQGITSIAMGVPAVMIIMPIFSLATAMRATGSRTTLIFLYIGMNVPFTIFYLLPFFKNLPSGLEEAAAVDGCSPVRTFWRIMFPLAQPGIITVTIFNFITIWNEFFISMIFANDAAIRPIAVGLFNMVQGMRYAGHWGAMFASAVIVFAPTFILFIFLSNKILASVTGGAIKG